MNVSASADESKRVAWAIKDGLCVVAVWTSAPHFTASLADEMAKVFGGLRAGRVDVTKGLSLDNTERMLAYSVPWEYEGLLALRLSEATRKALT